MSTTVDLVTGKTLPSDLSGIPGLCTGTQANTINTARIVVSGRPGTGKSSLLHSNPRAFILDLEGGGRTVPCPFAVRYPNWNDVTAGKIAPPTYQTYVDVVDKLIASKKAGKLNSIDMIGFDTFDALFNLWKQEVCTREGCESLNDYRGGYGRGNEAALNNLFGMLERIHQAGLGWCILVHVADQVLMTNGVEDIRSALAVPEKLRGASFRVCEHMWGMDHGVEYIKKYETKQVNGKPVQVQTGTEEVSFRRLMFEPGGLRFGGKAIDIKSRGNFPKEMVIPDQNGWDALEKVFDSSFASTGA